MKDFWLSDDIKNETLRKSAVISCLVGIALSIAVVVHMVGQL